MSDALKNHASMTEEEKQIADELDAVLINWFVWSLGYQPSIGYPTSTPYHIDMYDNLASVNTKEAIICNIIPLPTQTNDMRYHADHRYINAHNMQIFGISHNIVRVK